MNNKTLDKKAGFQANLLILVGLFMFAYALMLALAPAIRLRETAFRLDYSYTLPLAAWLCAVLIIQRGAKQCLSAFDPWLIPITAALTGWGLLTVWRLSPALGTRQSIWLLVGALLVLLAFSLPNLPQILKRYKYVWLILGLVLLTLTFVVGVNPGGTGPALWLRLLGVYLQPSEPLKLLIIVYLAAFFSDQIRPNIPLTASILPTLLIIGIAGLLLVSQRDLGTASLFISVYLFMLVVTTHRRRFLWIFPLIVVAASVAGYFLFDVVRARLSIWLNPWLETAGASYQLVQAQIAIAVGSLTGTGPGLGSPQVVPVAVSDFLFSAIAEETGLLGSTALLLLLLLMSMRGIAIALKTRTTFGRYLAFGISAYIGLQSFFIIGGNLNLLPLTGVTLPFMSYGGSSLVTNLICMAILLILSNDRSKYPLPEKSRQIYHVLSAILLGFFVLLMLKNSQISVINRENLVQRPENPRWAVYDRYSPRGDLMTQAGEELAITIGEPGAYQREVLYPPLSNVIGYTNGLYGQNGLEQSVYTFLRGYALPYASYWPEEVLYNQPPAGSDVRLNLNLALQKTADELLGDQKGAIVLLNAKTGEIYALASHPFFDANSIEENWQSLMDSEDAPLLNRSTQAVYPIGSLSSLMGITTLWAEPGADYELPALSPTMDPLCYQAMKADDSGLDSLQYGCESAVKSLILEISGPDMFSTMQDMGLFIAPNIALEVAPAGADPSLSGELAAWLPNADETVVTPLQMALVAATYTNDGIQPAPKLVNSYQDETGEWRAFPDQGTQTPRISAELAQAVRNLLVVEEQTIWFQNGHAAINNSAILTWYIGGTTPEWTGAPLAIAIAIEGKEAALSQQIGRTLLGLQTAE